MRVIKGCLGLVIVLVLSAGAGWPQTAEGSRARVEQLWREALTAQQAQQYDKAIALYREALAIDPELVEAEVNLGLMYQLKSELEPAIACFKLALRQAPDLYAPNLLTGLDYQRLSQPEQSLPYLSKSVALQPKDAKAVLGLANSDLQLHRYGLARELFARAVELDGRSAEAWYGLGASYFSLEKEAESRMRSERTVFRTLLLAQSELQQGQRAHAIELFKTSLAQNPPVLCSRADLGFAYLEDGQAASAEREFQSSGGCLAGRLGLAALAAERGQPDRAVSELRAATAVDAAAVRTASDQFLPYFAKAGREADARQAMEQSGETPPASLSATDLFHSGRYSSCAQLLASRLHELKRPELEMLAECAYYAGNDSLVLQATDSVLKTAPDDAEALYWRISSLGRLGLLSLATATGIKPDSVSLHMMYADMLRSKNNFSQAEEEYRKAIALDAKFLPAHASLARTLYWDNKRDEAEAEAQVVLRADPAEPDANYVMGDVLVARQEFDRALPFLSAALRVPAEERPHVHAELSKVYDQQGQLARAIAELKQALAADADGSYHYRLARLLERAGEHSAAMQAMTQSRQLRAQSDEISLVRNQ